MSHSENISKKMLDFSNKISYFFKQASRCAPGFRKIRESPCIFLPRSFSAAEAQEELNFIKRKRSPCFQQ